MSERMQSLLSRAVEDQLSEQRQLAGALADVRAQLSRLSGQLEGLGGGGAAPAAPQLEQALGTVSGEVREAVRLLGERLDGVGRLVQQRGHDLAEQRAVLGELRAAVDNQTDAIAGVAGGLGAVASLGERIEALQSALGGLGDRLRGLEELTAAVGALQQRSEATDASLRELRQAFSGVAARAAQLPGREDLDAVGGRVAESVDGLGGRLARLETSVPSLLERLDALAETQSSLQGSLTDISGRLDRPAQSSLPAADLAAVLNELQAVRDDLAAATEPDDEATDMAALAERIEALHEGVLGGDGVIVRLDALETADQTAPASLDAEGVEELVGRAVAASEERLTEHFDEAILLLAEALLRRRTSARAAAAGGPFAARPSAVAGVIEDEDDDEDDDEDIPGVGPWERSERAPAVEDDEEDAPVDDESAKRKPWWRPGG
jgi:hypothetical protein